MNAKNKPPLANADEVKVSLVDKNNSATPGHKSKLPHERDESPHATDEKIHPEGAQAHSDLKKGLVDTDARAADGRPLGSRRKS